MRCTDTACNTALHRSPPNIYFKKKKTGGVSVNSTLPLTKLDDKLIQRVLQEYKIHNCEVSAADNKKAAHKCCALICALSCLDCLQLKYCIREPAMGSALQVAALELQHSCVLIGINHAYVDDAITADAAAAVQGGLQCG